VKLAVKQETSFVFCTHQSQIHANNNSHHCWIGPLVVLLLTNRLEWP